MPRHRAAAAGCVSDFKPETRLARGQLPALDRATIHAYEDATPGPVYYQRSAHPVGLDTERVLGELDGGHARCFPRAAAPRSRSCSRCLPRARRLGRRWGLPGTVALLENELARWGLKIEAFDQTGEPPNADLVWLEPCANPMMSFPDLDTAIAQAHAAGAVVVVDNTVLSPVLLRPLEYGADFVLHSASKILAGHHDALLGVVTCARAEDHARLASFRSASGIVAAPDPAWLLVRGLKTLALRVARQSTTALELARRLAVHPAVLRVRYPGLGPDLVAAEYVDAFGPLLSFDVADAHAAAQVERSLQLIENATSLGGVASTLEARARGNLAARPPGLLRLSVGLEDVEDLWGDLSRALDELKDG